MIDVYEFIQNPVLCNEHLEDDFGDAHIIDYTQYIQDMDTNEPFWPFDYEAA